MKDVLVIIEFQGMTCIGATLKTGNNIVPGCEYVHYFSFAFISPLKAKQNINFHL